MIRVFGTVFAGLLGLAFGSFLNVCLSRWPEGESVVQPRSHCRNCAHTLAWWENVPLVSWLALRGRCRGCRGWIGWRYPLVEAAVGGLWAVVAWPLTGLGRLLVEPSGAHSQSNFAFLDLSFICLNILTAIGMMIFYWFLVGLAVLDAEDLWLPDWLTLPGVALGLIVTLLRFKLASGSVLNSYGAMGLQWRILYRFAFQCLVGILAAAFLVLLIRWVYWLIRHREGMGLGDAKLMAMLAAWLGLPQALLAFALGVVLGALAALVLLVVPSARRESGSWAVSKLPLGTFLCIGGIVSSLWGQPILAVYLRWAGF